MESTSEKQTSQAQVGFLRRIDRRVWPFFVLLVTVVVIYVLFGTRPKAGRGAPPRPQELVVEVMEIKAIDYPLTIESFGTVRPRTQSFLVSQVNGMVTSISDKFRDGAFISKGDLLLKVDDRDYRADRNIADASLADARQAYAEEEVRSAQARLDWQRLGETAEPSDLVLRMPQLQAAKARVVSAEAGLEKVEMNLERTEISAPFDGRLIRSFVDVGQVVSNNMQLGEIYATDYVEVRLPLHDGDLRFVDLPEEYREGAGNEIQKTPVLFRSVFDESDTWEGSIVRVESTIDSAAQQLHVVAQIEDPFSREQLAAIKIGQYVTAEIQGKVLSGAIVIPETAIYQNSFVYIAKDGVLQRRDIELDWQSGGQAIIASGLEAGDQLILTSLGQVISGTRIRFLGDEPDRKNPANRPSERSKKAGLKEGARDTEKTEAKEMNRKGKKGEPVTSVLGEKQKAEIHFVNKHTLFAMQVA